MTNFLQFSFSWLVKKILRWGGGGDYYTEYGGTLKTVTVYWLVDFGSQDMAPTDSSDIMGSKSDICEKAIDFVVSFFSDYIRVECPY